jgi:hypothetical protein
LKFLLRGAVNNQLALDREQGALPNWLHCNSMEGQRAAVITRGN